MFGVSHYFFNFVFLKSIGIGYLLGFFYMFFRFLRFLGLRQVIAVFFQDVAFCCISGVAVFLLLFEVCSGIVRFYVLAGILIGFIVFLLVPGKIADHVAAELAKWVRSKRSLFLNRKRKYKNNEI